MTDQTQTNVIGFQPNPNFVPANPGHGSHTQEVGRIQAALMEVKAWIAHRLGYHPNHEKAREHIGLAVSNLEAAVKATNPQGPTPTKTSAGLQPPDNQTNGGAATSVPNEGPSLKTD